jgi:hypothetical protein
MTKMPPMTEMPPMMGMPPMKVMLRFEKSKLQSVW